MSPGISQHAAATWYGYPALQSPNNVLVLFDQGRDAPPVSEPQSAIWHFGWHVTDVRSTCATSRPRAEVTLLPLYTTDEGGSVLISSDTWPGTGGVPGRTQAQIEEARAHGTKPAGGGGFAYMRGRTTRWSNIAGNYPAERFNHVHLYQEDPLCALLWYQKHLNAPVRAGRVGGRRADRANCKVPRGADRSWPALNREGMFRSPRAGVEFGDVVLTWYTRTRASKPLARRRGQLQDHIALSVADLDAWMAKLQREGVVLLEPSLSARRHPRRHDRGAEPGSDGTGRGQIAPLEPVAHKSNARVLAYASIRAALYGF